MSAPLARPTRVTVPFTPVAHRRLRAVATTTAGLESEVSGADDASTARSMPPAHALGRGSPAAVEVIVESRAAVTGSRARHLDQESQAWVDALQSIGSRRDDAIRRLHTLLVREARFEVRRRTAPLSHPSGSDLDDLAVQSADDAVVAILAKLDRFRGDSLFTTWARRFAQHEAPAKLRRRLGRGRELPMDLKFENARMWPVSDESPHERCVANESARTLNRLIAEELTAYQRDVLIALTIDGVATNDLARRLDTTAGALYKTLHDARRKLKAGLAASA